MFSSSALEALQVDAATYVQSFQHHDKDHHYFLEVIDYLNVEIHAAYIDHRCRPESIYVKSLLQLIEQYKKKAAEQQERDRKNGNGILSGFLRTEFEKFAGLRAKKVESSLQKRSRACWIKALRSLVYFPALVEEYRMNELDAELLQPVWALPLAFCWNPMEPSLDFQRIRHEEPSVCGPESPICENLLDGREFRPLQSNVVVAMKTFGMRSQDLPEMLIKTLVILKKQQKRTFGCRDTSDRTESIDDYIKKVEGYTKDQSAKEFRSISPKAAKFVSQESKDHKACWIELISKHVNLFPAIEGRWDNFGRQLYAAAFHGKANDCRLIKEAKKM